TVRVYFPRPRAGTDQTNGRSWSNQKPLHRGSRTCRPFAPNRAHSKEDRGFIEWLGLSLCISDRHAEGHMLAVAHWRHAKDEPCSDKTLAANSLNYAAKKANNRCDKRSTPGNPHRQHCDRATAFGGRVRRRSAPRANPLSYFISSTTAQANGHKD